MPVVVRCQCGQKVYVAGTVARCASCGRRVGESPDGLGEEPAEEIREFATEPRAVSDHRDDRSAGRRMLEALLDPRAIRWLLTLGGSLAVIGLIVWAYSKGIFDDRWTQAGVFGVGTLAMFLAGGWLTLRTRYQTAGVALAFLGAVVAPLNLWFYHAQELLTVDDHLWVAGVVCCAIYGATILVLRRPVFLYAFQIGVTLTVLLLLGDLGEVGATGLCVTMAVLGAFAVHLERAFPPAGDFDRRVYGPPLLWTGVGQFVAGLVVLAAVQAFAWSHLPAGTVSWLLDPGRLSIAPWTATALWVAGAYVALYLAMVPRFAGGWTFLAAAGCLLMAETTVLIGADASAEAAVVALALTGATACVAASRIPREGMVPVRAAVASSVGLSALPVFFGYLLLARGAMQSFRVFGWDRPIDGTYALAMTLVSACLAASAVSLRGHRRANAVLRFLTAGGVLLAAAGTAHLFVGAPWSVKAAVLTLIPLAYLIEGTLRKDETDVAIAHTAFGLFGVSMFLAVCHQGLGLFIPEQGKIATLGLAIVAAEFTAFLLMTAARCEGRGKRDSSAVLSVLAAGGVAMAAWQGLAYVGRFENWHVATLLGAGLSLISVPRVRTLAASGRALFACGATLLLATAAATDLRGFALMATDHLVWRHLGEVSLVVLASVVAAAIAAGSGWRRGFLTVAGVSTGIAVLLLASLAELSGWQRMEVLSVVAGVLLLVAGHVTRFREPVERESDLVDFSLWVGGALATVLLAGTAFYHRFVELPRSLPDEVALVTIGLLMLATGVAFRFKATTLYGGGALGGYLILLIVSLLRRPEVTMGAYLAVSGAALFLLGLGLSIYRDRLLALPERIAKREGPFRILDWR